MEVWDAGRLVRSLKGHKDEVLCLTSSQTGQFIASGSANTTIKLWSKSNGELIKTLEGHKTSVWSVDCSPDGNLLVSSDSNGHAIVWDLGELSRRLKDLPPFLVVRQK